MCCICTALFLHRNWQHSCKHDQDCGHRADDWLELDSPSSMLPDIAPGDLDILSDSDDEHHEEYAIEANT